MRGGKKEKRKRRKRKIRRRKKTLSFLSSPSSSPLSLSFSKSLTTRRKLVDVFLRFDISNLHELSKGSISRRHARDRMFPLLKYLIDRIYSTYRHQSRRRTPPDCMCHLKQSFLVAKSYVRHFPSVGPWGHVSGKSIKKNLANSSKYK